MERKIKLVHFDFVRRARWRAIGTWSLRLVVVLSSWAVLSAVRFSVVSSGTPVLVYVVVLFSVAALLELFLARMQRADDARARRQSVPTPEADDATLAGNVPLRSLPGSRFSRLPGARCLLAPQLAITERGLEVAWRWGRFLVAWRDIAKVEARLTSVVVKLRAGREIELETVRLPSGWGPDDPELVHAQRAAAIAALSHNETIASALEAHLERARDAYRGSPR
jgi:hypothetical protein